MKISSEIIKSYGEEIFVDGISARGFISPIDIGTAPAKLPLPNGVKNTAKYRMLTDFAGIREGACVMCNDCTYDVLRVEEVRIFGAYSHTEAILRLKEEAYAERAY